MFRKKIDSIADMLEKAIGTAQANVTIDIPIDATTHSLARLTRPGYLDIDETELIDTIQSAANEVVELFLEFGKTEFLIKDDKKDFLNVVIAVSQQKGEPIEFTVITVMKKEGFKPKYGTTTVFV